MNAMWNFLGMVLVALIGLVGVIIQSKQSNKLKKQTDLTKEINDNINLLREETKEEVNNVNITLNKNELATLKRFLVVEMTKIQNGDYIPNEEEKSIIHEAKNEYNKLGGDSYVDTMFDRLVEKGLL